MHLSIIFVDEDHTLKCLDNVLIEHRHREKGLFMSARGIMNADVNAAYNIIKIPEAFAAEADGTEGVGCGVTER